MSTVPRHIFTVELVTVLKQTRLVPTFQSVDKILKRHHLNKLSLRVSARQSQFPMGAKRAHLIGSPTRREAIKCAPNLLRTFVLQTL